MSNSINNQFEELCTGYVLNALTNDENSEFLSLLESASEEQNQLFEDMKIIASEMALLATQQQPSEHIKEQFLQMAWASVNSKHGANVHYLPRFRFAAAASVVFMMLSLGLFFFNQNLKNDLTNSSDLLAQRDVTIRELKTEIDQKSELLAILEARDVDLILMDGLDVNPTGYGKVVWDKDNGQALLQVANLPNVPLSKDYQLWFVVNNQPISAGVFAVNNSEKDNFFKIEQFQQSASDGAFAITLEPEGGSPQPTGDMYLLGSM
tara:strand:+ start:63112 stop:63906 length:795 start_codon:yes stop_codon:yes gene_type:complete